MNEYKGSYSHCDGTLGEQMIWGVTYLSQCPMDRIADIICREAPSEGYIISSRTDVKGVINIRMVQMWPRFKVVRHRRPQDVYWKIWHDKGYSYIYCDSKLSTWYLILILLSCALFALTFWRGASLLSMEWAGTSVISLYVAGVLLFSSLALLFVNYALVLGGGVERLAFVTGAIRLEARQFGTFFEPTGTGISPRHAFRTVIYLIFVIFVILFPFREKLNPFRLIEDLPIARAGIIGILAMCVLALIVFLPMMLRLQGFSLRIIPALAGIITAISILFILYAQMPWSGWDGVLTIETVQAVARAQDYVRADEVVHRPVRADGRQVSIAEAQQLCRGLRFGAWLSIAATIFLLAMGCAFLHNALNCVLSGLPYMYQLAEFPDLPSSKRAMTAGGFIRLFRIIWGSIWLLIAVCILWGMYHISKTTLYTFQGLTLNGRTEHINTVEASLFFIGVALNAHPESVALSLTLHLCWLVYVVGCWALFTASVGSAFVQRCLTFHRLRSSLAANENMRGQLSARLSILCRQQSPPCRQPEIAITESKFPFAKSHRLGVFRGRPIIEVTTRCLEILNEKELDALLAHELAHQLKRHCLIDDILRFIGRVTFFGDGFVRVLEDSFRYESRADHFAVTKLHIDPTDLKKCLWKVRNVGATETLCRFSQGTSMAAAFSARHEDLRIFKGTESVPFLQRLKLAIILYIQQYLGLKHSGYWHPSTDLRIEMVDTLS